MRGLANSNRSVSDPHWCNGGVQHRARALVYIFLVVLGGLLSQQLWSGHTLQRVWCSMASFAPRFRTPVCSRGALPWDGHNDRFRPELSLQGPRATQLARVAGSDRRRMIELLQMTPVQQQRQRQTVTNHRHVNTIASQHGENPDEVLCTTLQEKKCRVVAIRAEIRQCRNDVVLTKDGSAKGKGEMANDVPVVWRCTHNTCLPQHKHIFTFISM